MPNCSDVLPIQAFNTQPLLLLCVRWGIRLGLTRLLVTAGVSVHAVRRDVGKLASVVRKRILTLDIETAPARYVHFGPKVRGGYLPPQNMTEPGRVLCFAAKWFDRSAMMFHAEWQPAGHDGMIQEAWDLMDQADIIVGYNSKRFDVRQLKGEFLQAGMTPPRPHKDVDLLTAVRSKAFYEYNSLNELSMRLGIGQKVPHAGMPLWLQCLDGDKAARALMRKYNCADVELTEAVYRRVRGWLNSHPHVGHFGEHGLLCNVCGSSNLTRAGTYLAVVIEYAQYRCAEPGCGALVRAGHERRVARSRGVQ